MKPVLSMRPRAMGDRPARVTAGISMLVGPKGPDSFKEIEKEVDGDPLKRTAGKMTPGVAKVKSGSR